MSRFLLALLGLLLPQTAPSDTHGSLSSQTEVVDRVAEDVRHFQTEREPRQRIVLLKRLGPIRDPRVVVAMMERVVLDENADPGELMLASWMVVRYQIPPDAKLAIGAKYWTIARLWWGENEVEVRRRAERLPK